MFEKEAKLVRKRLWRNYKKHNLKVYLVDGNYVRNNVSVSYGIGGHHWGYSFIPTHEIWLEKTLSPRERKFILLHELYERKRMRDNKWNFLTAHEGATMSEQYARQHPSNIESKLKALI